MPGGLGIGLVQGVTPNAVPVGRAVGGGGGGASFPDTGLDMRYAARLETGLTDAQEVDTLTDQSGSGFDLSPTNASNKVTWEENELNGHAVYRSTPHNGYYVAAGPTYTDAFSAFFLVKTTAGGAQEWHLSGHDDTIRLRSGGTGDQLLVTLNTSGFTSVTSSTDVRTGAWVAILVTYDGANIRIFIDDLSTADASTADTGNLGGSGDRKWVFLGDTNGNSGIGEDIAEMAVWDHALDSDERDTLDTYLADTYGV